MRKCILVVEDEGGIRTVLRELLEEEGYTVEVANDGLTAWENIAHRPGSYEAILLDLCLPRMSGLQLIRMVRSQQETLFHSIIVLSADEEAIRQAIGMGICHALKKPFDLEVVLKLVQELVLLAAA